VWKVKFIALAQRKSTSFILEKFSVKEIFNPINNKSWKRSVEFFMSKKVLVTGGAGYIGSHTVKQLRQAGYEVVVYDNLSTGVATAVNDVELVVGSLEDTNRLAMVFALHNFDAVLHFAASISVPDSVSDPLSYYSNNTANTLNLLRQCQRFGVQKIVFSSTAAVYGQPEAMHITESTPPQPLNPYGSSKLMSERMIQDYSAASSMRHVILRYFNVAGADMSGTLGQNNPKASHLIKVTCDAALGRREAVNIFGTDFDTPDGTGIRDYIHVEDLARAHVDALRYLAEGGASEIFNCGYGQGYSVREVIEMVKKISGRDFKVIESDRRAGDPAAVVAVSKKIREVLGWQPQYNDLEMIVASSYGWEKRSNVIDLVVPEPLLVAS
jgi:UDP-glucose 4-epimerase